MTQRERQILRLIEEDPMISQEMLAEKLGITRSSVAVHISNLTKKGCIAGRGYVLRTLRPFGKCFAILGSAILFGLFHGNLLQTPYAVLMGLLFGYVTVEYSLVWSIALHMFNNLVLADLLARLTASWPEMALGTLNLVLFGGSALLSVVILFANRKRIRGYQKGEWMDSRCLKCFFLSPGILVMAVAMCVIMISMMFAL